MRTTLTLEDDVVFGLTKVKEAEPDKPFKEIVNEVLRRGLERTVKRSRKPFKVKPFSLGLRKDLNFDNIEGVLDVLEGGKTPMILPDVNLLLYAYDTTSEFHQRSARWLETVLSEDNVFFTWQTLTGFLRIVTNPAAMASPLTLSVAIDVVRQWLELDNVYLVAFEKKDWQLFASVLLNGQATGNLVMDAHIAASAASVGATVATTDRDFSRFPNTNTINPLSA